MHRPSQYFSGSYAQARQKFLAAARQCGVRVESHGLPALCGLEGEVLATDVARIGPDYASKLLILSSGTHGAEGFCGSGSQVALLNDRDWLERVAQSGVAVLMIHAINPYGFSHLQRTNEDNVDPNRNFVNFDAPLPENARYAEIEALLIPDTWPPTAENEQALKDYARTHGEAAFRDAVTLGQSASPDGLFFSGTRPIWSNQAVRAILRKHTAGATAIGWIDAHTGLGPYGHAEKIYAGRNDAQEIARARAWWGADVVCPFTGDSASADIRGPVARVIYEECPQASTALIALEFGTVPLEAMYTSLRASAWARKLGNAAAAEARRAAIRRQVRDTFYCDDEVWKGMVLGQTRVAMLQALVSLQTLPG